MGERLKTISALFVETGGTYFGLDGVDPWDEQRDARLYRGPHPVVAHPPCERWGNYWSGGPSAPNRTMLGDDGGCFASALWSVRTFGGVIEHPAHSRAWDWFGLLCPEHWLRGFWTRSDRFGGRSCVVDQWAYGHRGHKSTWLYWVGAQCPHELDPRQAGRDAVPVEHMSHRERAATPEPFRDLLIELARGARA